MMVPCGCCGVMCEPEPCFQLHFATHRGPLCPDCWQAWRDPQRTCGLAELPISRPLEVAHDPRLWWIDRPYEGYKERSMWIAIGPQTCARCDWTVTDAVLADDYLMDAVEAATSALCPDCATDDDHRHIPGSWLLTWG